VKKRQQPTKLKRSPQGAPPSGPSRKEVRSTQEWESAIPEAPAAVGGEWEELPDIVEETEVVLLAVNPYLVHVYWGIAPHDLEELGRVFSRLGPRAQPVLRFYDIPQVDFDGANAPGWFEVEIDLQARNWYVHLESPAKTYCVALGLRTEGDGFQCLARSNVAETPRAWPSDKVEESYLVVEGDYPRVETVVPLEEAAEGVKTLLDPPSAGEQEGGEGKGPEPRELEFFRTAAPPERERKLAELFRQLGWERPGFAPKAEATGDPQPPTRERADLTEESERNFRAGLSSGQESS